MLSAGPLYWKQNSIRRMIISRKNFDLKGRCVVEKLIVDGNHRMVVQFPDEACYLYLRTGRLIVNSNEASTVMAPADGIVLNCGNYLADFIAEKTKIHSEVFAVHLSPDILREIFHDEIPAFFRSAPAVTASARKVSSTVMDRYVESLAFYFDNPEIVTEEILKLKIRELILLLVQSDHAKSVHELFASLFSRKTVSVSDVVNAHLFNNLSIEELAKLSALSVTGFKTEFAKLYHEPPGRYIRNKKLERARELLCSNENTISEIAYQVGFHDVSHFSKSFQAAFDCTPGNYRKKFV